MPLFVFENAYVSLALEDLARIADDPTLQVDIGLYPAGDGNEVVLFRGTGEVAFAQGPVLSSPGTQLLDALIHMPAWVTIRAEGPDFGVYPDHGWQLRDIAGSVAWDQFPAPSVVDIVYDATECDAQTYWTEGDSGRMIALPRHVILFHELSHALDLVAGTFNASGPEPYALNSENVYRQYYALPLRSSHRGGCRPWYWRWLQILSIIRAFFRQRFGRGF